MRILHIASENIAGVPGTLVKAERKLGHYSRLMTYFRSPTSHWDDIVLSFPLSNTSRFMRFKRLAKIGTYQHIYKKGNPPVMSSSTPERIFYLLRDVLWESKIHPILDFIRSFDCYILDGGLGFLRCGKIIESLKYSGKRIIILYLGSDLRSRGALMHIERLSDTVFTTEFDHLSIHPGIHHIFFPFEIDQFSPKKLLSGKKLTVCHAPTNRYLKGTEYLIDAVKNLKGKYDFDFLLMEGLPQREVLSLKKEKCDVMVDQLTDLGGYGYGMNSMECLAMGIPSITYMNPGYEEYIPDHPFINANHENIEEVLEKILSNSDILIEKGRRGREWVMENHNYLKVSRNMLSIIEAL